MRISPGSGIHADESIDIDWGLVLAAERFATGANIHDCRALLSTYRNHCEGLSRSPSSKYYESGKIAYEGALRGLLSGRLTVEQATKIVREWYNTTGKELHWQ